MGILRKWFGPSQAEIWQQLAREIGATYAFAPPRVYEN